MLTLGKRIKQLRKEFSLNQEQLGEILKVSRNTVSKYERNINEPDLAMLITIADYFKVSLDYLLCRSNVRKILSQSNDISLSDNDLHHIISSIKDNIYNIVGLDGSDFVHFLQHKNEIVHSLEQIFINKNKN